MARFVPPLLERLVQRAAQQWQHVIHPREDVPDEERQRAQAISALVVLLMAVIIPLIPIWVAVDGIPDMMPAFVGALILLVLLAAYHVSRGRGYRLSVWMLIAALIITVGVVFLSRLNQNPDLDDLLKFLTLPVILASLTLSRRATIALAIGLILLSLMTSHFVLREGPRETMNEVFFQIVIAVLTITASILRENFAVRLRASERRYRALFEQSRDPIFVITLDGSHVTANKRVTEVLGYPLDYLISRPASDFIAPRERGIAEGKREGLLAGETPAAYERHLVAADGTEIPFEMTIGLVLDEEGKPEYIQSVARDLRPRRQAEQEMLRANLERERARILARFVQGISHEFRTPLAVIGTSAYMLSKSNAPENVDKRRRTIEEQVARIDRLLAMMMTLVKLDAEEAIERHPVRLNVLIATARDQFAAVSERAGLMVEADLLSDLPAVLGDQRLLIEALRQVLANAIQYTPRGGCIRLFTRVEGDMVRIDVQDNGIGIPQAIQERVFERFFRGDEAHSTEGFGLGLSIAQAIIQRHGGRLTVESSVGAGSTFHLYLPIETG